MTDLTKLDQKVLAVYLYKKAVDGILLFIWFGAELSSDNLLVIFEEFHSSYNNFWTTSYGHSFVGQNS